MASANPFHEEIDGLVYRTAVPADRDAMWRAMVADFFPRMPLFTLLDCRIPEDVEGFNDLLPDIIAHGVTMLAVEPSTGEVVGIRSSTVGERDVHGPLSPLVSDPQLAARYQKTSTILRLVYHVGEAVDCHERYGVDKYLSFTFLLVCKSHSGRGVGRNLMECSLRLGRQLGLELAVGTTQNFYAQQIYQAMGFDTVYSVSMPGFVDPLTGEKPFAGLAGTEHQVSFCFAKRLL